MYAHDCGTFVLSLEVYSQLANLRDAITETFVADDTALYSHADHTLFVQLTVLKDGYLAKEAVLLDAKNLIW